MQFADFFVWLIHLIEYRSEKVAADEHINVCWCVVWWGFTKTIKMNVFNLLIRKQCYQPETHWLPQNALFTSQHTGWEPLVQLSINLNAAWCCWAFSWDHYQYQWLLRATFTHTVLHHLALTVSVALKLPFNLFGIKVQSPNWFIQGI